MPEVTSAVAAPRPRPGERFTFRGNAAATRHGWLRLTPAYSVHFVRELLESVDRRSGPVLDPFCGTGTTLLACRERGLDAATIELNPFLVWLARTKTATYTAADVDEARALVESMKGAAAARSGPTFVPKIHRVERWWDPPTLGGLGRAAARLTEASRDAGAPATDLARVAFCRAVIETANVSFGHQSMSFREPSGGARSGPRVTTSLVAAFDAIDGAARTALPSARAQVFQGDSRRVDTVVRRARFGTVVTSPPYSNRMSYIRELRPYMYWLGHLAEKRDAGDLDWRAIGGTWGVATSRLATWRPDAATPIPFPGFARIVDAISRTEPLLGRYVHRYFEDMVHHVRGLAAIVRPGGRVHYVVGNSKFYDVMLPAQEVFAALFEAEGFEAATITEVRKRTSKRELFEYLVEARRPAPLETTPAAPTRRPPTRARRAATPATRPSRGE